MICENNSAFAALSAIAACLIGEAFADIRPANTTVIWALKLPEMKVEIEVTARIGSAEQAPGSAPHASSRR